MTNIYGEQVNSFQGGMNFDTDKTILGPESYRYAENIRCIQNDSATKGVATNIEKDRLISLNAIGEGEIVIASATIRDYGILFSKLNGAIPTYNIYRLLFSNDGSLYEKKKVFNSNVAFNIPDGDISIVCRYENELTVKVYWADGVNPIRVVNVMATNSSINPNFYNVIPSASLTKPNILGLSSGKLNSGLIQYAYQFYSESGSESFVSPMSEVVAISPSVIGDKSITYKGGGIESEIGEAAGKSVSMSIDVTGTVFDYIKVYSVYYYNYGVAPIISLVLDTKIDKNKNIFYFSDGGASKLDVLTQAEFNIINSSLFIPAKIEQKDNILFAANIKEESWDLPYDTRAYQFKLNNGAYSAKLDSSNGSSITITPGLISTVPLDHDCIHSEIYEKEKYSELEYIYDIEGNIGGYGQNVSYMFANSYLIGSHGNFYDKPTNKAYGYGPTYGSYSKRYHIYDQTGQYSYMLTYADGNPNDPTAQPKVNDKINGIKIVSSSFDGNYFWITMDSNTIGDPGDIVTCIEAKLLSSGHIIDEGDYYIDMRTPRIGDTRRSIESIMIKYSNGTSGSKSLSELNLSPHLGPLDYSNPFLSNVLTSYCRDEIYRFGAVLYSDDAKKTEAKWIADIRFPAGYIENQRWSSSIFEMPVEVNTSAYVGTDLDAQELLIKPLGLKFKFTNIPKSVARIEIVRTQRDINNKTIYGQGVFSKIGTQKAQEEYRSRDTDPEVFADFGKVNTLRPHSIISMGEEYSIIGPTLGAMYNFSGTLDGTANSSNKNDENASFNHAFWTETKFLSYDQYNDSVYYSNDIHNQIIQSFSFMHYVNSPLFANRNNFMFINPETSYYGETYVSSIRDVLPEVKFDIVDVIAPIATPATKSKPNELTRTQYFGSQYHAKWTQFTRTGAINNPTGTVFPTMMYFGAGITPTLRADDESLPLIDKYLHLNGLVGASFKNISEPYTGDRPIDSDQAKTYPWYTISGNQDKTKMPSTVSDIYTDIAKGSRVVGFAKRAYISTGGYISYNNKNYAANEEDKKFVFKNGNWESEGTRSNKGSDANPSLTIDYPITYISKANDSKLSTIVYKYFTRFHKPVYTNIYGANGLSLIVRDNNKIESGRILKYSDIDSIKLNLAAEDIQYSKYIKPGVDINIVADYVTIGQSLFLNWAKPLTYGDTLYLKENRHHNVMARTKASGAHGDGMLVNFKRDSLLPSIAKFEYKKKRYTSSYSEPVRIPDAFENLEGVGRAGLATYVANIKYMNKFIYGGPSIAERQFNEYISTNSVLVRPSSVIGDYWSSEKVVFSGDTFIGLFDYTINRASDPGMKFESEFDIQEPTKAAIISSQIKHIGALIPLESSINMNLSMSESFVASDYNFAIQKDPGVYGPMVTEGGKWITTQSKPEHKYNAAYSSQKNVIAYFPLLLKYRNKYSFDNRVKSSEPKTNDEVFDSWAKFRIANYIDLDTRFGEITRLKTFNNKLLFWQENAFGVLATNERALIGAGSDSQLTLGTSGILERFDYISTSIGLNKNSINSLTESPSFVYWYDKDRAEIFRYGNNVDSVSRSANMQSFFTKNKKQIENNVPIIYDNKYNELFFSFYGVSPTKPNN